MSINTLFKYNLTENFMSLHNIVLSPPLLLFNSSSFYDPHVKYDALVIRLKVLLTDTGVFSYCDWS